MDGLLAVVITEPNTVGAVELLAEARDLTARFRLPIGHILATAWLSLLQTIENPRIVVDAIPEIFDEARTTGQQPALLLGILGRDLMHPLAAIDRLDAVPILDAASTTCIRPALAADAVTRARRHYGDEEYDRQKAQASTLSMLEIEQYLLEVCAEFRRQG